MNCNLIDLNAGTVLQIEGTLDAVSATAAEPRRGIHCADDWGAARDRDRPLIAALDRSRRRGRPRVAL